MTMLAKPQAIDGSVTIQGYGGAAGATGQCVQIKGNGGRIYGNVAAKAVLSAFCYPAHTQESANEHAT
jgi:hypothetical protein